MLAERHLAVYQRRFDGRKLRSSQVFFPEQLIHRAGANPGQEHSFGVHPAVAGGRGTGADEHRPRSAQRNEFVRIHRQIVGRERAAILDEVTGHPVVFAAREIFQLLAPMAPVKFGTAFAR